MRKYELMMIVNPALAEAERTELIATIESELADAGAKVLEQSHPGEQRLAYRIRTSDTGYYLLYTLESEGNGGFFEVSNSFNIKKDIWRYMFTKIED
jgi:ribosomal protein S6